MARKATLLDFGFGLSLATVQVILFWAMRATSRTSGGDPFDSRLLWWAWLILPALACLATAVRPWGPRPRWWTGALVAPFGLEVALFGTIFHNPDEGASFWIVGKIFVLVLGA